MDWYIVILYSTFKFIIPLNWICSLFIFRKYTHCDSGEFIQNLYKCCTEIIQICYKFVANILFFHTTTTNVWKSKNHCINCFFSFTNNTFVLFIFFLFLFFHLKITFLPLHFSYTFSSRILKNGLEDIGILCKCYIKFWWLNKVRYFLEIGIVHERQLCI